MRRFTGIAPIVCILTVTLALPAADWPGWRGPERTGVSTETGLLKEWPSDGPKLLWKNTSIGGGYSTPSSVGDRVYVLGYSGNDEFLLALDTKDGKEVWKVKIGAVARGGRPGGGAFPPRPGGGGGFGGGFPGPRATPTVDGDLIFSLGSDGDLVCTEKTKGEIKWQKNLRKDFGGQIGTHNYCESPLIDGDALICCPGGRTHTMVALKKTDGSLIWKCEVPGGDRASYASTIVTELAGVKQYVAFLSNGVVGVAAKDGKFLWRHDKTAGRGIGQGTNALTPVAVDGRVFTTSSGGSGAVIQITAEKDSFTAKEVYTTREDFNQLGGVVLVDGYLYGTTEGNLTCIDFKTGKQMWRERSVGKGSVAVADGMIYVRAESGRVALVELNPKEYKEKGRFDPPSTRRAGGGGGGGFGRGGSAYPHPVIANGCLYLREGETLLCYEVKK